MPAAYILRCADGSYYVGSTRNLAVRLDQHASGKGSAYTSRRLPVELVWAMESESIRDVYAWERRIHGWSRAKREALIRGDEEALRRLARRRGGRPPSAG